MNTKEQVNEWDRILDEYENSIGLGTYKSDILSEEIEQISADE